MADILTIAQARAALDWKPNQNVDRDGELTSDYIPAVTRTIESRCGRMLDRRESWRTDDSSPITTPWTTATIKAVTVAGVKLTGWSFAAGVLTITDAAYTAGDEVTITAGGLPTPADVLLVARRILKRAWNADHQGTAVQRQGQPQSKVMLSADDEATLEPYWQMGGFA